LELPLTERSLSLSLNRSICNTETQEETEAKRIQAIRAQRLAQADFGEDDDLASDVSSEDEEDEATRQVSVQYARVCWL